MKKITNFILTIAGIISLSNFAGAYDVLEHSTVFEIPNVNYGFVYQLDQSEQNTFFSLLDALETTEEENRRAIIKTIIEMYGEDVFEVKCSDPTDICVK